MSKIKLLIIDDSALVRKIFTEIFSKDARIEVVGTAMDPLFAVEKIKKLEPDVLTLDLEMPRMDGLSFLRSLMRSQPLPTLMISSLTPKNADTTIRALELGAFDVILKPQNIYDLENMAEELISKVVAAAQGKQGSRANLERLDRIHVQRPHRQKTPEAVDLGRAVADAEKDSAPITRTLNTTDKIIAIGSSTGGTVAIEEVLKDMPSGAPGIVIVQHMPAVFTKSFAERLNDVLPLTIKEAEDGDQVLSGFVYIAPGHRQCRIRASGAKYFIEVFDGEPVNRHAPSVSVLFESVAREVGKNAIGIMLTGMGEDGAKEMRLMRDQGSFNVVQDEASCVVFGMPKKAIEHGAADQVVSLEQITPTVLTRLAK